MELENLIVEVKNIVENFYGIAGSIKKLPGEVDLNFLISSSDTDKFILKIASPTTVEEDLSFQNSLLLHLSQSNLDVGTPIPCPNKNKVYHFFHFFQTLQGSRFVRLIHWLPGNIWADFAPKDADLRKSLGKKCASLSKGLAGFDHTAAHKFIKWDPQTTEWIFTHFNLFTGIQNEMANHFFNVFKEKVLPIADELPKSINHNDLNDYNILVDYKSSASKEVIGFIDFGDAVYTYRINELAITAAYAIMQTDDPITALIDLTKGYHEVLPLSEQELEVLFPLTMARLLISVTCSAMNRAENPDNEYLQISEAPAWELLEKCYAYHEDFVYYSLRSACQYIPCPIEKDFHNWLQNEKDFFPVLGQPLTVNNTKPLDLSVGSSELGNFKNYQEDTAFNQTIQQLTQDKIGIGGYNETRPFYTTDEYAVKGNSGPKWRTVHLGYDLWTKANSTIYAPLDGTIVSVQDNAGDRNYGPTVIIEHKPSPNLCFYTLYGHLSSDTLRHLNVGQAIKKGASIGWIGAPPENGNWPPHLHFQIILNKLNWEGDFPGVAYPEEQNTWLSLCPDPSQILGLRNQSTQEIPPKSQMIKQRHSLLGRNLSVSYQNPLHIVRGVKQYLISQNGRRYLDMVNNVAHVGHEHPRVVEAGQRQMGVLNTNSRYLHKSIIEYAEKLLATFPDPLNVVYFVNSGSEANELAMRLAKTYSDQKDFIALQIGYHGNTNGCVDVSSYKFDRKGGKGAPKHTSIVPMPDTYRGVIPNNSMAGVLYANYVQTAIDQIENQSRKVAGFFCESIMSCGGQIVLPPNYLPTAYEYIRNAGGLCIADEVQVGFGRVGKHFWGFQLQGVIPDIVTIGKPIGNGHPMGAVVTTKAIADRFANGMEFFSTFGGNPVSCAIGQEVLQVIQDEGLQENAVAVGQFLLKELHQMKSTYPIIGDVRGEGLFLGIELIKPNTPKIPSAIQATYLVNQMKERGILLSTDGPDENVIKIKPPMCFNRENAHFFLDTLNEVLKHNYLKEC